MSANTVYNHIEQMTEAQPIIWWKAGNNYNQTQQQYSLLIYFDLIFNLFTNEMHTVCYHYVRRSRQVSKCFIK